MLMIEMREAAYDKAFDLVDEIKEHGKATKMAVCALEDTLYDCYEASKEDEEYENDSESPKDEYYDVDAEVNFRNMRGSRSNYRNEGGYGMRSYRRRNIRMRRRSGR